MRLGGQADRADPPLLGGAGASCGCEAIALGVFEELGGGFVCGGFVDATADEVAQFVGVDVLAGAALGAFAEGFGVKPRFAQMEIGDGGARVDDYAILESEMVHDGAPCGAITDEIDAMSADEGEFADEALQLGETFLTCLIVRANDGDAGRQSEAAGGLCSQRSGREVRDGKQPTNQENEPQPRGLILGLRYLSSCGHTSSE